MKYLRTYLFFAFVFFILESCDKEPILESSRSEILSQKVDQRSKGYEKWFGNYLVENLGHEKAKKFLQLIDPKWDEAAKWNKTTVVIPCHQFIKFEKLAYTRLFISGSEEGMTVQFFSIIPDNQKQLNYTVENVTYFNGTQITFDVFDGIQDKILYEKGAPIKYFIKEDNSKCTQCRDWWSAPYEDGTGESGVGTMFEDFAKDSDIPGFPGWNIWLNGLKTNINGNQGGGPIDLTGLIEIGSLNLFIFKQTIISNYFEDNGVEGRVRFFTDCVDVQFDSNGNFSSFNLDEDCIIDEIFENLEDLDRDVLDLITINEQPLNYLLLVQNVNNPSTDIPCDNCTTEQVDILNQDRDQILIDLACASFLLEQYSNDPGGHLDIASLLLDRFGFTDPEFALIGSQMLTWNKYLTELYDFHLITSDDEEIDFCNSGANNLNLINDDKMNFCDAYFEEQDMDYRQFKLREKYLEESMPSPAFNFDGFPQVNATSYFIWNNVVHDLKSLCA